MKKLINGKRYNTESARYIGEYEPPYAVNDFKWYKETMYRKQTGEFFLHGEGNGDSPYAEKYIDGWGQGEKLVPLKEEEAKKWAEDHLEVDAYDMVFTHNKADEEKLFTVWLPINIYEKVKSTAESKNVSMRDIVINQLKDL